MRHLVLIAATPVALAIIATPAHAAANTATRVVANKPITVTTAVMAADAAVVVNVKRKGKGIPEVGQAVANGRVSVFWADRCIIARATAVLTKDAPITFTLVNVCKTPRRVTATWKVQAPEPEPDTQDSDRNVGQAQR